MMRMIVFFSLTLGLYIIPAIALAAQLEDEERARYEERDHLIADNELLVEWLRCSAGQIWDGKNCTGKAQRLNMEEIEQAINQANQQLGGRWRLPNLEELQSLICETCKAPPLINAHYFPDTPAEPFWSGNVNQYAPRHFWTVNFFTGHTYGRFFPYQRMAVRLVRDRLGSARSKQLE